MSRRIRVLGVGPNRNIVVQLDSPPRLFARQAEIHIQDVALRVIHEPD